MNIEGNEGGHAWVEVYEDNRWLALEATTGPFYDDESHRLIERRGLPYNYYKTRTYPSVEIWFYYNDVYYVDFIHNKQNAPSHWLMIKTGSISINKTAGNLPLTTYLFALPIFCSFRLSSLVGIRQLRCICTS